VTGLGSDFKDIDCTRYNPPTVLGLDLLDTRECSGSVYLT
jgi:hypothetical protein